MKMTYLDRAESLFQWIGCSVVRQPGYFTILLPARREHDQEVHLAVMQELGNNQYIPIYEKVLFTPPVSHVVSTGVHFCHAGTSRFVYYHATAMGTLYERRNAKRRQGQNGDWYIPFTLKDIERFAYIREYPKRLTLTW